MIKPIQDPTVVTSAAADVHQALGCGAINAATDNAQSMSSSDTDGLPKVPIKSD